MSTTTLTTIKTTMKHLQALVSQLSEQQQIKIENTLQSMVARALAGRYILMRVGTGLLRGYRMLGSSVRFVDTL